MAIPSAPSQVCALVWYAYGYAYVNNTPNIGVYCMVSPTDAASAGIKMRVERCTGTGCTGFTLVGNSNGVQFAGSGAPQAEFIDAGVYATIYRYRVRLENNDGVGPWSSTIEIDTTIQGTATCDFGAVADFQDELRGSGFRELVESSATQVRASGFRDSLEWKLRQLEATGQREIFESLLKQVQATGLRIIIEYVEGTPAPIPNPLIEKSVDNPTPIQGGQVVWTITVTNPSGDSGTGSSDTDPVFPDPVFPTPPVPDPVFPTGAIVGAGTPTVGVTIPDVVVNDLLPAGLTYVSHVASVGTYDPLTGIWVIGDMEAGAVETLAITTLVTGTGTITNIAVVTPGGNGDDATINTDQQDCPELPLPLSFPEDDADFELKSDTCVDEL